MADVRIPAERVVRWVENFERRHGAAALSVSGGALSGRAEDGSTFTARLPFEGHYAGTPDAGHFAEAAAALPADWGIVLVRKGGFAIARLHADAVQGQKVGRRHVQGRSKAGGWSQQRFARRRDEQARQAFEAAADHAARLLQGLDGPLITGGDHAAVDEVLTHPELRRARVVGPWLAVPDPRAGTLEQARTDAAATAITVVNAS